MCTTLWLISLSILNSSPRLCVSFLITMCACLLYHHRRTIVSWKNISFPWWWPDFRVNCVKKLNHGKVFLAAVVYTLWDRMHGVEWNFLRQNRNFLSKVRTTEASAFRRKNHVRAASKELVRKGHPTHSEEFEERQDSLYNWRPLCAVAVNRPLPSDPQYSKLCSNSIILTLIQYNVYSIQEICWVTTNKGYL